MSILNIIYRVLAVLSDSKSEVKLKMRIGLCVEEESARIDRDLVEKIIESERLAGTLRDLDGFTVSYKADHLHDQEIKAASAEVKIFKSANMSLGINVLLALVKQATKVLGGDADIEIVEKHHNRKLDAPSGTALMIADAASEALEEKPEYVYERHSVREARKKNEIGISAVRGGTIVGEHEVIFAGPDELIEIRHVAYSRAIFANGALQAAKAIAGREAGLYDMQSVL